MVEAEVQDKSESAASKNRSHQECVALTSSAFVGVPVGVGDVTRMAGHPQLTTAWFMES